MKNLERYVFGAFLSSFFLAFLVLSFVLTIGLMVQIVSYILQGVPMDLVGRFALVSFPETMQWTVPIALLVSSILVFSRLSADSEIAAMRACGVNLLTVMRWPLAFALLCTFVCLFVNNEIVPRGHEVRRNLTRRLSVGAGLELLEPGRTINDFPKVQLYFHSRDAESGALQDLEIVDRRDPKCTRNFKAKQAFVRQEGRDIVLDVRDLTVDPVDPKHPNTMKAETFRWRAEDVLKDGTYKRKEKDFRRPRRWRRRLMRTKTPPCRRRGGSTRARAGRRSTRRGRPRGARSATSARSSRSGGCLRSPRSASCSWACRSASAPSGRSPRLAWASRSSRRSRTTSS